MMAVVMRMLMAVVMLVLVIMLVLVVMLVFVISLVFLLAMPAMTAHAVRLPVLFSVRRVESGEFRLLSFHFDDPSRESLMAFTL